MRDYDALWEQEQERESAAALAQAEAHYAVMAQADERDGATDAEMWVYLDTCEARRLAGLDAVEYPLPDADDARRVA